MNKDVNLHLYILLAVINIGVFVFLWSGAGSNGLDNFRLLDWGANFAPLTLTGEPWRLLTSAFLHGSWTHLLLNMYMLFVLGSVLERAVGALRFATIYLLSALGGSLVSAFWYGYHEVQGFKSAFGVMVTNVGIRPVVSVGASGALMGLAGAAAIWAIAQFSAATDSPNDSNVRISLSAVGQVIVINLLSGFVTSGIDQAAHLGGLSTGLLAGAMLYPYPSAPARLSGAVLPVTLGLAGSAAIVLGALHGQNEQLLDWRNTLIEQRTQAQAKAASTRGKEQAKEEVLKEPQAVAEALKQGGRTIQGSV
ncbi:hypothetical protein BTH42_33270 [Burkholderia sp. SRS-W-2-2016]|uniref:rhomboid family intramembrane serine protease n=1 Tax=Burkholderia sp. SRS-W-2-2016 TaxID=1926878 RepID=UPI00094B5C64|nr:rhomboid family intramembrane serine protease [Burkholderia sp. SRS-W-2-2016]OLL27371.1 hypothetical protein BTH42_33270 [Burkholderia sp. SRS-W-2-2016]